MICLAVLDGTLVLLPVDVKMGVWLEREQEELPDRQHRKPVYFFYWISARKKALWLREG